MTRLNEPLDFQHGPSWRNRLTLAPLTNQQSHPDGTLSDDEIRWLTARAEHGFGMVMTAAAYVTPAGQAWPGQLGISDASHETGLTRLADALREAGTASIVQLHHGGFRASAQVSGVPTVAPYDDPETGARALTTSEIGQVVEDFAAAAARAERTGFDGVQIHGAHGYLLSQFLDAERNRRDDGYGGDAAGRSRIIREVIDAVRAATSSSFHVGLRLSVERFGIITTDMVAFAEELMADGHLDHLDLSLWDYAKLPEGAEPGSPSLFDLFVGLPRGTTRLGVAGKILDGPAAVAAMEAGADFVDLGRAAIADQRVAAQILADGAHPGPVFPVTRQQLRDNALGEAFVAYFAKGWPHLVAD